MSKDDEQKRLSFDQMLSETRDKINWNITVHDDDLLIYSQQQGRHFEELSVKRARMAVREIWELATPSTIASLTTALTEDSNRLFDDNIFLEHRSKIVGFENGVFDLTTGKMRAYQAGDYVLDPLPHKVPFRYDAEAERELLGILQGRGKKHGWVDKEAGDWFLNVLAYILFIYPNHEDTWFNFFGSGSNGKSVCLELLEQIVGDKKSIGCDLKNINRFSGDTFRNKWLVVGRDSSAVVSDSATSFIKAYTGEPKLLVERKGGASWDVQNPGKMIVSTNGLINSRDRSYGWYRRLIPVLFPHQFPRNPRFKQDLMRKLPHYIRVLLRRAYLYRKSEATLEGACPKPVEDLRREVRISCDRVAAFWEAFFFTQEEEDGPFVLDKNSLNYVDGLTMSQLYAEYVEWHQSEFGSAPIEPSLHKFGGRYGAFLSGDAKQHYTTKRTNHGRVLQLKEGTYFE